MCIQKDIITCDDYTIIKELPTNSIDLICIDPPYEIAYKGCSWDKAFIEWTFLIDEFHRLLTDKGNLIIFQGWSNVTNLINLFSTAKISWYLQNWIIWDRIKGRGAKTNMTSTREDILWYTKIEKGYTFNKIYSNIPKKTKGMGSKNGQENRSLSNIWTDIPPIVPWSAERVEHPTQKPIALIERIVTIFSNEKDTVLDCFAGSGTTAVACQKLDRSFICIENNKEYCKIANGRLR